jgi:hypothetical protein
MTSYHFDCGNSNDGPVGFCARIRASSEEEALRILHEAMPETIEVRPMAHEDAVEYIHVYTGTENVTVKDIDDEEAA